MTIGNLKQLANRYKIALLKNNIPVSAIYLFGSYARGTAHKGSDVDFCVVSNAFGRDDFKEMVAINQIAKQISAKIEAFPVAEKELKARSNPFIKEALKNGEKVI